jgi:radical SAM superfamily enzyme YgiQ (UPF0313 family)
MADILLAHGYFLGEDEKEQQIMKPYAPLGLLYLSAWLKRAGFSVEVFDTTFRARADLLDRLGQGPGVLGLYTNLMTRRPVLEIMREAKRLGWIVVLGGPESANYPEEYLRRGADAVVIGEGEITLAELLPALAKSGPQHLHDVPGLAFRDADGAVITTAEREQIANLNSVPWPDRAAIDQQEYVDVWRRHHGSGSVNLNTARGCPYKCKWCSHAVYGYTHRRRDPIDCAAEVAHIQDVWKPDQVWYADDVFTINHRWLFSYAAELKRRAIRLPFETISRADRMLDERVLETLAGMGCYRVWIGSESGSQRILDAMQRGVTVEHVQQATRHAQRHGIQVGMFLMWGYDGEELSDIEATVEHVKRANPDIFFTTVSYPIKNTPYFDRVQERVSLPRAWESATDRDYVIAGRHSRRYYKLADQWLRNAVAAERAEPADPTEAALRRADAEAARRDLLAASDEIDG